MDTSRRAGPRSALERSPAAIIFILILAFAIFLTVETVAGSNQITLSCPGDVTEGDDAQITFNKNSAGRIKVNYWTETPRLQDHASSSDYDAVAFNHAISVDTSASTHTVSIGTTDDSAVENDEYFLFKWGVGGEVYEEDCTVKIVDNDRIDLVSEVVTSSPAEGDTYGLGETIELTLTFNGKVEASSQSTVRMEVGHPENIQGSSGDGLNRLLKFRGDTSVAQTTVVLSYTVKAYDYDKDGLSIISSIVNGLKAPGTDIAPSPETRVGNQWHLSGHKVDGRPRITGITAESSPPNGEDYRILDKIEFNVQFDAKVNEFYNTPKLAIKVGEEEKWAPYNADRTSEVRSDDDVNNVAVFVYEVEIGDQDTDGVSVPNATTDSKESFGGGSMKISHRINQWALVEVDVHYDHDGMNADSDQIVDGVTPLALLDKEEVNDEIRVTGTFYSLPSEDGVAWRIRIFDSNLNAADDCEGENLGLKQPISKDDIDNANSAKTPLTVSGTVSPSCEVGEYFGTLTAFGTSGEKIVAAPVLSFEILSDTIGGL